MRKIFLLIFFCSLLTASCGRKGPLTYIGERQQAKFDDVIDEEENLKISKKTAENHQPQQEKFIAPNDFATQPSQ